MSLSLWQAKLIQRHLTLLQLSRYVGIHHEMSASLRLELVAELCRHYDAGLQLGYCQQIWCSIYKMSYDSPRICLQCFDAVGWVAGRASCL